jgi:UDP-N-acetylglucosamine acyltransferase
VVRDVPPYVVVDGNPAKVRGLNLEGLRRQNLPVESLAALKEAYRCLYRSNLNRAQAIAEIEKMGVTSVPEIANLVRFLHESERGRRGRGREAMRSDIPAGGARQDDDQDGSGVDE